MKFILNRNEKILGFFEAEDYDEAEEVFHDYVVKDYCRHDHGDKDPQLELEDLEIAREPYGFWAPTNWLWVDDWWDDYVVTYSATDVGAIKEAD